MVLINYFDIIIDGCSLIHFDPQPLGDIKNKGLHRIIQIQIQVNKISNLEIKNNYYINIVGIT
jgi:hypothetical protein